MTACTSWSAWVYPSQTCDAHAPQSLQNTQTNTLDALHTIIAEATVKLLHSLTTPSCHLAAQTAIAPTMVLEV